MNIHSSNMISVVDNNDDAYIGDDLDSEGIVEMSKRSRKELDIMNALHNTGVQFDVDLPQIIAVGMQSSGKSSLIEAFSGTSLPRAAGTCTRCPTECRLTRSDSPWKCIVSLRFIADSTGRPLGQARIEKFGEDIYKKDQVEDRVRRAQRAILNPDKSAEFFLHSTDDDVVDEESQLTFSVNCVTLEISGPKVADLSFCDLPGLIASVTGGHGSSNDINLVENLVTSYMKKPSCIILLTVACETDFENQGAHHLAKKYDPKGLRTVGVLTKPDRIPQGEEQNWIQFIRNDKEPLKNNWFCVKQPSSQELKANISWSKARENENVFFRGTPWSELEATHQNRLGTQKLVERLSRILSALISERIPQIRLLVEASITSTRFALSQLPQPPSDDPRTEILMMLYNFVTDVGRHVEGVPDNESQGVGLIQSIRPEHEIFRKAIRVTAPRFTMNIHLPDETPAAPRAIPTVAQVSVAEKCEAVVGQCNEIEPVERYENLLSGHSLGRASMQAQAQISSPIPVLSDFIHIDEVLERANNSRTRELPGHYPFSVQKTYIKAFVGKWKAPSLALSKAVFNSLSTQVNILLKKHFGAFGQGYLERRVSEIVHQHIMECLDKSKDRIAWLLRTEEHPFSLNSDFYTDQRSKYFAQYRSSHQRLHNKRILDFLQDYENGKRSASTYFNGAYVDQPIGIAKVLSALAEIGLGNIQAVDITKLLSYDQMEPAIVIMADVMAYFEVAHKRYVDNVPLAIDLELVRGTEENLIGLLITRLEINGPEGDSICGGFAEEIPQIAERRAELQKKMERLQNAFSELGSPGF